MINGRIVGIDARMVEMSGIGVYIQHLLGQGIYDYALGDEHIIRKYDKDVKVIPFNASIYSPGEQLKFPNKEIKKAGISLMHFPHYNVPISYRGDYVVTIHDLTHIVLPEALGNRAKYYYARFLMEKAVNRAKHVFTDSENSKTDIEKCFQTPADKITITYNAVDSDFRIKGKNQIEYLFPKYNIPKEKKTVLYVGNLKAHKNLKTLLEATKILNRDDIILLLVGKAFKSVDLENQEIEIGIKQSVIHTGMVSNEELVDLYNLSDVFAFPSLYEGFGIPPLEAMACGTPVVAANNSSIPEVVGDAAILVDGRNATALADAIEKVLDNPELQNEMIRKGLVRYKVFSWEKTRETVRRVLSEQ